MEEVNRHPLQFRMATLFWLMFATAMFFAGRYWDEITVMPQQSRPAVANQISIKSKRTTVINTSFSILKLAVGNPGIVQATPLGPRKVQLRAMGPGVTSLQLFDDNGKQISYTVTVPAEPKL